MNVKIHTLNLFGNERRDIIQCLKKSDGLLEFGELQVIKVKPNAILGNHFHTQLVENLIALHGTLSVILVDVNSLEKKEMALTSNQPVRLEIGPHIAHAVLNQSNDDVLLLEYRTKEINQENNDIHKFMVLEP